MAKLPAIHQANLPASIEPAGEPFVDEGEFRLRQLGAVLKRNLWLLLGCSVIGYAGGRTYSKYADPVYQAAITVRVDQKQPNLPDIFQDQRSTGLETDVQVLGSRTLVEDAVRRLALRVRLQEPVRRSREEFLDSIALAENAPERGYRLVWQTDSTYAVLADDGEKLTELPYGRRLQLDGLSLRIKDAATTVPEVRFRVGSFRQAVDDVREGLATARTGRDADLIAVRFEGSDPGLVWQVPNVIAERFIERRREARKVEARSQVRFLRQQIDTLTGQLATAEEAFKDYRERARVISPQVEASSQITRLVQLEAERGSMEAERSALATLMEEAEQRQANRQPGAPSAYRDLLAFPSLLRSQAASQLLSSLSQVEDQRATLLTRRTMADPDVQFLTARINELEGQLGGIARTYLQGLSNQLASMDRTAAQVNSELRGLPQKELQYARLERTPTVLKEMHSLLQTRLKEAEIAEAVENSSISIVDPAIPPRWPFRPRPKLLMAVGAVGGLLLGLGLAMLREYADRTVRTRAQASAATGLPVMAIIPRIRRRSDRPAVIAKRSQALAPVEPRAGPAAASTAPPGPDVPKPKISYTFFASDAAEPPPAAALTPPPAPSPLGEPVRAVSKRPDVRMTIAGLGSAVAEAYAILQTNIAFSRADETIRVLALTSPLPSEGKTTTAVNFALTLAERGLSVCLLDADLRRGQVHEVFGLPRGPGLSEVLQGKLPFDVAARVVKVNELRQLTALTCGGPVDSPPGLVGSARMRALLEQLREHYDLIVIDTPPVNILTDAALIGVHADGVLLVVRAGATDIAALSYAMEQLRHVRAPALGVVLNDVDIKRYSAYDGAYKYASYETYLTADAEQG